MYWADEHCRQIFLAGSADRGYVSPLRIYRTEDKLGTKIVLVESVPFPRDFRELADWFHTTSFKDVFRSTKLATPVQMPPGIGAQQTHATAIAGPSSSQNRVQSTFSFPLAWEDTPGQDFIFRKFQFSRSGQRIDERLHPWNYKLVWQLKKRDLCPRHFITVCNQPDCGKSHDGEVDDEAKFALMRIARDEPCSRGTVCTERQCISAHHCVHDGRCNYGADCKYAQEMHGIDKVVATVR